MKTGVYGGQRLPGDFLIETKRRVVKKPKQQNRGPNWGELFLEYINSGRTRVDFLRSKGINPNTGSAHKATRDWVKRVEEIAVRSAVTDANEQPNRPAAVLNVVEAPVGEVLAQIGRSPVGVAAAALPNPWVAIKAWRQKQATEDYKTADTIRMHLKLLMKTSLRRVKVKREDGVETEEFQSTLKPHELKAVSQVAADIQRIQRLALGMSTENVGVDHDGGNHIEPHQHTADVIPMKPATPPADDQEVPVFIVEMSHRGKFVRARPRKVN
jgi:hypothetical protein